MLKKLTRGHRWLAAPVVAIAAAGFVTQGGAVGLSSHSRVDNLCRNLAAQEARINAALLTAPPDSRQHFNLEFRLVQVHKQENRLGCP